MFESAELGRKLSKREYERQLPELRARLVQVQFALKQAKIPVIIVISGVDGAGKGDVVHRLNEWLDPRGLDIHAFWQETESVRERPSYWHFWQALPPRGRIGLMFGSWYTEPVIHRVRSDQGDGSGCRAPAHCPVRGDAGARRRDHHQALVSSVQEGAARAAK